MTANKKGSVQKRILIAFVFFALLTVIFLTLCQSFFFEKIHNQVCINVLQSSAAEVTKRIETRDLYNVAQELYDEHSCQIYLLDHSTKNLIRLTPEDTAGGCLDDFSMNMFIDLADTAESDGSVMRFTYDSKKNAYEGQKFTALAPSGTHNVVCIKNATSDKGYEFTVFVNMVVSSGGTSLTAQRVMTLAVSVIMIVGALALGFYISKAVAKPIIKLNNAAQSLGSGGFDTDFSTAATASYDEIAELASTLQNAQSELARTDSIRRELIANVSHDLRTPLTLMSGYLEMMKDFPSEINDENLEIIRDECERLTSLVADMIEISKYEAGNVPIVYENFDLSSEIENSVKAYSLMLEHKGYRLCFEHNENLFIRADKKMTMQAFYNLLNNALTYTGDDKTVLISQRISDGFVRVEVTDSGEGIDKDKLHLIFERYYKIPSTHKRAAHGTGLGLSIVSRVITAMGGRYGVRSAIGHGSTFWFELPLAK